MARTEIFHEDATLRVGACRNLFVCAWYAPPESAHILALSRALQTHNSRHGEDHVLIDLLLAGKPIFTDDVRDGLVRVMRDNRAQGQGAAHVIEVTGLAGVTMRAFLSTTVLMARPRAPHKVFGEVQAAATWLLPLLAKSRETWTVADLVTAQAAIAPRKAIA